MGRKNRINTKSCNILTNLNNNTHSYERKQILYKFFRNVHNYYCCQKGVVINSIQLLENGEGKIL